MSWSTFWITDSVHTSVKHTINGCVTKIEFNKLSSIGSNQGACLRNIDRNGIITDRVWPLPSGHGYKACWVNPMQPVV
jgi:hypothetical protein